MAFPDEQGGALVDQDASEAELAGRVIPIRLGWVRKHAGVLTGLIDELEQRLDRQGPDGRRIAAARRSAMSCDNTAGGRPRRKGPARSMTAAAQDGPGDSSASAWSGPAGWAGRTWPRSGSVGRVASPGVAEPWPRPARRWPRPGTRPLPPSASYSARGPWTAADRGADQPAPGLVSETLGPGLPVLCEKPCGLTVEEARRCAEAAGGPGLVLQVAYWRRFVPDLMGLNDQLGRRRAGQDPGGELLPVGRGAAAGGVPAEQRRHLRRHGRARVRPDPLAHRPGVHRAAPGRGPDRQAADPDCAQMVAELDGGSLAMVSLGRWHPAGDICRVEVYGTNGTAVCPFCSR